MLLAAVRGSIAAVLLVAGAPHHTVPEVRAAVHRLSAEEDQAVQEYDQAAQELRTGRIHLRVLNHEVRADRRELDSMRAQLAQIAAATFETGTVGPAAVPLAASPQAVLNQASVLGQLSASQQAVVREYAATYRKVRNAQLAAYRAQLGTAELVVQLDARKRAVKGWLAKQQTLLASLTPPQQQAAATAFPGGGSSAPVPYTGSTATAAGKAVAYAYSKIGDPYVWGATGPSTFDCSGLVMAAWAAAGVTIPRTTYEQVAALPAVSVNALEPGDLLFFLSDDHVGMYVGNGMLIDAPHTGASVELVPFTGWFRANFDSAARP